ncbi:MAG: transporter substrate-binding domain-containing protein [Pseudomonadota bacterium]
MTFFTKSLGAITGLAIGLSATLAAAQEVLRVGVSSGYPPFDVLEPDGTLSGFDIDIANLLCAEMEMTCEFVDIDWDGIIPALQANRFDAIVSSMGITEDRMKQVDFTDRYYYSASALIGPKDTGIASADEAGTAGKAIGVQRATAHECYVQKFFPGAQMRQYQTSEEAYLDLQTGRIDAVLVDTIPGEEWINSDPKNAETFAPIADDLYDFPCFGEGIGIAVRKGEDELREGINAAIEAIRASGAYQEVSMSYFGRDIYGPSE